MRYASLSALSVMMAGAASSSGSRASAPSRTRTRVPVVNSSGCWSRSSAGVFAGRLRAHDHRVPARRAVTTGDLQLDVPEAAVLRDRLRRPRPVGVAQLAHAAIATRLRSWARCGRARGQRHLERFSTREEVAAEVIDLLLARRRDLDVLALVREDAPIDDAPRRFSSSSSRHGTAYTRTWNSCA